MVKDVSASCADKALQAQRNIIRLGVAALLAFGSVAAAAELPASPSPLATTPANQASVTASPILPFETGLPVAATGEPFLLTDNLDQQQLIFPVSNSIELNVAMGGSRLSTFSQEYAGTTGIWRPVESLSFKAGIGLSQKVLGIGPDRAFALPAPAAICATGVGNYLSCLAARASGGHESLQTYVIGANWNAFGRISVSLDYTSSNLESTPAELVGATISNNSALVDQIEQAGVIFNSRTQALDFSLSCDIGAGNWGDLELGLQVSRIMTEGALNLSELGSGNTLADPYTQASLGVGWQLGDFRSDLTSRYLDILDGQGNSQTPWTSLDVNFSWRTPWNGSLSVGARNVFNKPAPKNSNFNKNFDDLFGRVPYVRYRQDL